jgi:PAS domain S-box-containing protein/excisionase family DNA binding protein
MGKDGHVVIEQLMQDCGLLRVVEELAARCGYNASQETNDENTAETSKKWGSKLLKVFKEVDNELKRTSLELDRETSRRKQIQELLLENEIHILNLIRNSRDIVLIYEFKTWKLIAFSDQALRILGYDDNEIRQLSANDIDVDFHTKNEGSLDSISTRGFTAKARYRKKDGTTFPVEFSAGLINTTKAKLVVTIAHSMPERNAVFPDLPNRKLLKPSVVADVLGVSSKTIYRWCDMGLLENVKINRSVRISRSSVVGLLDRLAKERSTE